MILIKIIRLFFYLPLLALAFSSTSGYGQETEPVDKNIAGPFIQGSFTFGQANSIGGSTSGTGNNLSIMPGYVVKRDTWKRIELGLEVGSQTVSIDNSTTEITFVMPRVGYGYSLGDHSFMVWQLGFGQIMSGTVSSSGGGTSNLKPTGLTGILGGDAVFPISDSLKLVAGGQMRYLIFSGDFSGQTNIPSLHLGARLRI